jgi:ribosomal protein S27AE
MEGVLMAKKMYRLYCEICNWNKVTDGSTESVEGLHEVTSTQSGVPGGVPKIDPETNKVVERPWAKRQRTFRCPNCGRTVQAKQILDPQAKVDAQREELRRQERAKKWFDQDEVFRSRYEEIKQSYTEDHPDE